MKFSKLFNVFKGDGNFTAETFVSLVAFYAFLKSKDARFQSYEVKRSLKKFPCGIINVKGIDAIPVKSVLRYCFHHADSSDACKFVSNIVQNELLEGTTTDTAEESSFDLYRLIAKTQIYNKEFLLDKLKFDEKNIPTLIVDHKPHFTTEEWAKISLFEHQFSKDGEYLSYEYDDVVKQKFSKFQSILSFKECSQKLVKITNSDVKERLRRKEAAEEINRVQIYAAQKHVPFILDNQVLLLLQRYCGEIVQSVISFDTSSSKKNNTIQFVVEVTKSNLEYEISDLCKRAYYFVARKHLVHVENVYFVTSEGLKAFRTGNQSARFQLRDEFETKRLQGILHEWHAKNEIDVGSVDCPPPGNCESCFETGAVKPLSLTGLDIFHEWFMSIPMEVQLFLQVFLNKRSLGKTSDIETFLGQKFEKLFCIYDQLLNVFNRNYIGIFQEANTNEMLVEYKSVRTVFDITAAAGATTSLCYAETSLKKKADNDMCYYNTYLKEHPLEYVSASGEEKDAVCLRDCHVILLLDNLVRFTAKRDTLQSDSDEKQLNTLPITLQGLPGDSNITNEWHLPECDGSNACVCKQPKILGKSDVDRTLLCLSRNEDNLQKQFSHMMTWSMTLLWDNLPGEILQHIDNGDSPRKSEDGATKDLLESLSDIHPGEDDNQLEEDSDLVNILSAMNGDNHPEICTVNAERISNVHESQRSKSYLDTFVGKDSGNDEVNEVYDCPNDLNSNISCQVNDTLQVYNDTMSRKHISYENALRVSQNTLDSNGDRDYLTEESNCVFDDSIEWSGLNQSLDQTPVTDIDPVNDIYKEFQRMSFSFGFSKFSVPPLLCRHPPPASGRDDDMFKIKEILDDTLLKMGYTADKTKNINRILCGPDNKIGKNIFQLMKLDPKYKVFLPEFPLLHLRKSHITILFSAYQEAGLVQLLQFMRDEKQEDWKKLVSIQHIDTATKYVRRLALSLHLAFLIEFSKSLSPSEQECFWTEMETVDPAGLDGTWTSKFETFLEQGSKMNATFSLHADMMRHCDHVVQIAFAERLGGPDGYNLMIAAVKDSLRFLFVNNASSYAPYCVKLLCEHFGAGFFHTCLKQTLFTTPFKGSNRNFASDTKREMDHLDALKGFRSGSTMTAVTCRMSLMDTLNEVKQNRFYNRSSNRPNETEDSLGWTITEVDEKHIFPVTAIILRQGGLSLTESAVPCNVYTKTHVILPAPILDEHSKYVGEYLLWRYLVKENMFQLTDADMPASSNIMGPSDLVSRAKRSKGITIKRTVKSKVTTAKTESQVNEEKRQKTVAKKSQRIDSFSSLNNGCQAILKPDSSKPKVMKSVGMQRAIKRLVKICETKGDIMPQSCSENNLVLLNQMSIPDFVSKKANICMVEFAGVKFKLGSIKTGNDYIHHVEAILKSFVKQMPSLSNIVICEEKYSFTPDDFKAGTREQRKTKNDKSVIHLKTATNIINETILNKDAVTKTDVGKRAISTFLAANLSKLSVNHNCQVTVDSEFKMNTCKCQDVCSCQKYTSPLLCDFTAGETNLAPDIEILSSIKQRKGEAEMAVTDWLVQLNDKVNEGEAAISIITSGDIDAVAIHLYVVSRYWSRDSNNRFTKSVFVVLQKPYGRLDIYNITGMLTLFESKYCDKYIGMKVALGLCIGGNDFIPKLYQVSHEKVLCLLMNNSHFRQNLFTVQENKLVLNVTVFVEFIRTIYCPSKYQHCNLPYEHVRAITIGKTKTKTTNNGYQTTDPKKWLPPKSAIERLAELLQLQISYMNTAGIHDALPPNFLGSSCLRKNSSNEIEYDFGPESHFQSIEELPNFVQVDNIPKKRPPASTPQKGLRRKRQLTSTPKQDLQGPAE